MKRFATSGFGFTNASRERMPVLELQQSVRHVQAAPSHIVAIRSLPWKRLPAVRRCSDGELSTVTASCRMHGDFQYRHARTNRQETKQTELAARSQLSALCIQNFQRRVLNGSEA